MATFVLTVTGGVIIYAASQWLSQLVFEPTLALRRVVNRIASDLIFLGNVYANPRSIEKSEADEAARTFRAHASELAACGNAILIYRVPARLGWIPGFSDLVSAHRELIGLSNSCHDKGEGRENDKRRKRIQDALRIQPALR